MRVRHLVMVLALALFASRPLAAQETTGKIEGRVTDTQGLAVPGATVTATGPQGSKTAVTDGEGRYSLPFLTPGTYAVHGELAGFKAVEQKDIAVRLGQTSDVSLKFEVGGVSEVVQVTGASRAVDTTSTTIGAVLSTDELSSLPVGRRVADVLYLSPGVSSSGTLGTMNPSISGGSGLENQYVVDGTNVTNAGYGGLGSYSIVFGSLGNATPYDFIQEIQVKTGGYDAENGQATGGVVNVVTKSGTNAYRASVFGYTQPTGLQGSYKQFQATNGSVSTINTSSYDAGAEGGGPIIKNKLFFFGAIDPAKEHDHFQCASRVSAGLSRRHPKEPENDFVRRQSDVPAEQREPDRRVVLRRPVARRDRPAADLVVAEDHDVRLQHARLRRPPADRALRRRDQQPLPPRRLRFAGRTTRSASCLRWTRGRSRIRPSRPPSCRAASAATRRAIRA